MRGERAKRASLDEDEHTRDESREMATDIMATSTTKLTHPIRLTRLVRSCFIKNAPRFARRRIEVLEENAFQGLESLEYLNLAGGNITTLVSNVFAGLESLTGLELRESHITTFESGCFNGLERLEWIFLGNLVLNKDRDLSVYTDEVFAFLGTLKVIYIDGKNLNSGNEVFESWKASIGGEVVIYATDAESARYTADDLVFVDELLSIWDARQNCVEMGGDLVSIVSQVSVMSVMSVMSLYN